METVNVDIRKLQLLNDRINQTIDALNQLRMSVHGLQHTTQVPQNIPWGYSPNVPMGQVPMGQVPMGQVPVGGIPVAPFGYGISHTMQDPRLMGMGQDPRMMGMGQDPRMMGMIQDPRLQDPRFVGGGVPGMGFGGLTHSMDPNIDPFWRQRMLQSFPYLTSPYAPLF